MEFLGISRLWVRQDWTISASIQSSDAEQKLFLVFQRASEGDLLDFVDRQLRILDEMKGWMLIASILCGIAGGLAAVHKRGVIHGSVFLFKHTTMVLTIMLFRIPPETCIQRTFWLRNNTTHHQHRLNTAKRINSSFLTLDKGSISRMVS